METFVIKPKSPTEPYVYDSLKAPKIQHLAHFL